VNQYKKNNLEGYSVLRIMIWHKGIWHHKKQLGEIDIPLATIKEDAAEDRWYPMYEVSESKIIYNRIRALHNFSFWNVIAS